MPLMQVNKTVKYKGAEFKPGKPFHVDEKDVEEFTKLGGIIIKSEIPDNSIDSGQTQTDTQANKKPPKK